MEVNINGEIHYFSDNVANIDNKYNKKIKLWYYIFCIINIINIFMYYKEIHKNDYFLIVLPFFHIIFAWIILIIKWIKSTPDGDNQYIKTYYPEIAKKLKIGSRNSIAWINFINGEYIDFEKDIIIDNIRERKEENNMLLLMPFVIGIIFCIISFIIIGIKNA